MTAVELKTRKPTCKPSWPLILVAGVEKAGKSYAAAMLSGSDLVDRTFWLEIGETTADYYGAIPGARFEIVDHDGTSAGVSKMVEAVVSQERGDKPHALVIDSVTAVWDLISDEMQQIANARKKNDKAEAPITMDLWNLAKKRWGWIVDRCRTHDGPVILTARLERVTVVDKNGSPTSEKDWKVRAEKNLPFDVDAIVELPEPGKAYLNGVRSLTMKAPLGAHLPYPGFTVEKLLRELGFGDAATAPRNFTERNAEALAATVAGAEHAELVADTYESNGKRPEKSKPKKPADDEWTAASGRPGGDS